MRLTYVLTTPLTVRTSHISHLTWSFVHHTSDFSLPTFHFQLFLPILRFFLSSSVLFPMANKTADDLLERTFNFSSRALRLCNSVGSGSGISVIKNQLIRSATSVGANYRTARRARSRKDFISKLAVVEEEADECGYWLSLLEENGISGEELSWLKKEANEIAAIMVASRRTARKNIGSSK